ncbi:CHAT domain-containing protein [Streptomyces caelestis]|uniref:CHAT domain-containing protein n=1 Tax=Streptomyces caelestis TaxID=36816 RepID=UPI00344B87F2
MSNGDHALPQQGVQGRAPALPGAVGSRAVMHRRSQDPQGGTGAHGVRPDRDEPLLAAIAQRWAGWHDETTVSPGALLVLTVALRTAEAWSFAQIHGLLHGLAAHGSGRPSRQDLIGTAGDLFRLVRDSPTPLMLRPVLSARRDTLLSRWLEERGETHEAGTPWGGITGLPEPAPSPAADQALTGLFHAVERTRNGKLAVPDLGASHAGAPWQGGDGHTYPKAPAWMSHNFLVSGEDQGRRSLGAVPWWYVTVTNFDDRAAVWHPRSRGALENLVSFSHQQDRFAVFTVTFPPVPRQRGERGSPRQPALFRFTYDLIDPWDTAHFALAVRSGCARLDVLYLDETADSLPEVRRTLLLEIPPSELAVAQNVLDGSLAAHGAEGFRRLSPGSADTGAAFHRAERLCSRDRGETLDLLLPDRIPTSQRRALRALQDLRAERARRCLVRKPVTPAFRHRLWKAELKVRAQMHPAADPFGERLVDDLTVLGSDDRVFVHVLTGVEGLRLLWARTASGRTRTGMQEVPDVPLERFAEQTVEWVRDDHSENKRRALDELLVPFAETLTALLRGEGARSVVLRPSGLFSLLPLHVLPVPSQGTGRLLDDLFEVTYAPSLSALAALDHRPLLLPGGCGFVGYAANDNLRGLPKEERVLRQLYGGDLTSYKDEHAVASEVFRLGRTASFLHISGHGGVHGDPYATAVSLAPENRASQDGYEGELSLGRVLAEGDFDSLRLAVLATCDSGRHSLTRQALPRVRTLDTAFVARGVRAVVSTLWPLSDLICPVFTAVLHAHLKNEAGTLGDAFRAAIRYLRHEEWEHAPRTDTLAEAEAALSAADRGWRAGIKRFRECAGSEWTQEWAVWKAGGVLW